ncbi:MAG: MTAP family purine nucleoside phosphorylase [Fimbriimonadaceae bacterium]|nr:MTAP family purine nucleoside phosphorylase [Fimbriimonadaceae bacterium]QYK59216.1 MAG: MTAP family purine nucleoside phosphorylase [Fimbriimonadaceae bacterium]
MILARAAVVGGTGVGHRFGQLPGRPVTVPTPFGPLRGRIIEWRGDRVMAVQRHSTGHRTPPHRVNYRAMAWGLRQMGVERCVSSAAVGSLRSDWGAGTLAVCTDLLELTARRLTLWDREVRHTDLSIPFPLAPQLAQAAPDAKQSAVYVGYDGPRYEAPAEVRMLGQLGGDIVGMTAATEAVLLREAGVEYGCFGIVTNLGAGLSSHELAHGDVVEVMERLGAYVSEILLSVAVGS